MIAIYGIPSNAFKRELADTLLGRQFAQLEGIHRQEGGRWRLLLGFSSSSLFSVWINLMQSLQVG
jgi:hypothetical protein